MKGNHCRLSSVKFGFAFGLIWGLGMLLVAWAGWLFGYGLAFTRIWSSIYIGMQPTFVGGIIGFIWGFIDFFVFGLLVAWVYNCAGGCPKKSGVSE